jgi:hypothetical protein
MHQCFGITTPERWPAIAYTNSEGIIRVWFLPGEEILNMFAIPNRMHDTYECASVIGDNITLRLRISIASGTAELIAGTILDYMLSQLHDPEEISPMPRSASTMIRASIPTQYAWE